MLLEVYIQNHRKRNNQICFYLCGVEIYRDCNNCRVQNTVLTVGMFDGVHAGHRQILKHLVEKAHSLGGEPTLLTFWPHPRLILNNTKSNLRIITTIDEKIELLKECGLHNLVILPFDKEFSLLSPKQYVKDILVNKLHINTIIVGYDHRFGHKGEGHFPLLQQYGERYGFNVEEIPAFEVDHENVSSTKVRHAIAKGDIEKTNQYLTYNFHINGRVIEGKKIGRTLGFPTANIQIDSLLKIVPAPGVYIIEAIYEDLKYQGVVNIGTNPTIDIKNETQTIEAFIFDFDKTIYGEEITLLFKKRIREQRKFDNLDHLKFQIAKDVEIAKSYFNK